MVLVGDKNSLPRVAGYDVMNCIGVGRRSDVYLAHPLQGEKNEHYDLAPEVVSRVALKVFHGKTQNGFVHSAALQNANDAVAILARLSSVHIPRVVGSVLTQESAAVAIPWLSGGSLADLLLRRGTCERGEVVTVLVPVLQSIQKIHRALCTHGTITAQHIFFTHTGAPVLLGWAQARCYRTAPQVKHLSTACAVEQSPDFQVNMIRDYQQFVELARWVFCVGLQHEPPSFSVWVEGAQEKLQNGVYDFFAQECEEALFSIADPSAIRLAPVFDWQAERNRVDADLKVQQAVFSYSDLKKTLQPLFVGTWHSYRKRLDFIVLVARRKAKLIALSMVMILCLTVLISLAFSAKW